MKKRRRVWIERSDLMALLHWAAVGVNYSRNGSYMYITDVIPAVSKRIGFRVRKAKFNDFDMRVVPVSENAESQL